MAGAYGHILLTGHRGFVGSAVRELLPGAQLLEARSPSVEALVERLRGVDCIVHLAGGGGPRFCEQRPAEAIENNVVLTQRLVEAGRRAGVKRFVYTSSIAVYGTATAPPSPIGEAGPAAPDDLYGTLKLACEALVRTLPHTILRLSNVYGYGAGANLGRGGFVNKLCATALAGGPLALTSATLAMDFVHVSDVARAIRLAAEREVDGIVNIGSGAATTLVECARLAERKLGRPLPIRIDEQPGFRTRFLDVTRARIALGWAPQMDLGDGIADLLARLA